MSLPIHSDAQHFRRRNIKPMHHMTIPPLRGRNNYPGPVEIRLVRKDVVSIRAGGKCIQCTGNATGTWPTPVVIEDASVLAKLRYGLEVRKIEVTWADGVLDVKVAEMTPEPRYRRQPSLPFGEMPARPEVLSQPVMHQVEMGF